MNRILCFLFCAAGLSVSYAAQPIASIVAQFKGPTSLAVNSFSAAIYTVTNNSSAPAVFDMKPLLGVTQVTELPNACHFPMTLGSGQICNLYLKITGSALAPTGLSGGPVVCISPSMLYCSQPSQADELNVTPAAPIPQNSWLNVLIAQSQPLANLVTYLNKIISLAPNLKQIHFRFPAGANNYSDYANLIKLFRTAYGTSLLIGFHPDASTSSYSDWGCASGNWQCVLNATIEAMNAVDNIADPNHTGLGFNIYSIEQSYVFPTTAPEDYRNVKACLNPPTVTPCPATQCGTCPSGVTTAVSPYVKFGSVLPSYGDCAGSTDCQYGADALDYGYPQYYNLGKQIGPYTELISNGFFPSTTTSCKTPPYSSHLYVVDEDNGSTPYDPQIPCNNPANTFVYPDPTTGSPPDVTVPSAYLSYLMTQLAPISNVPDVNGATVYITFSGEGPAAAPSLFLGALGWTLSNILNFYTKLNADFSTLYAQFPPPGDPMFANGIFAQGINPNAISYAIWNFSAILDNE